MQHQAELCEFFSDLSKVFFLRAPANKVVMPKRAEKRDLGMPKRDPKTGRFLSRKEQAA